MTALVATAILTYICFRCLTQTRRDHMLNVLRSLHISFIVILILILAIVIIWILPFINIFYPTHSEILTQVLFGITVGFLSAHWIGHTTPRTSHFIVLSVLLGLGAGPTFWRTTLDELGIKELGPVTFVPAHTLTDAFHASTAAPDQSKLEDPPSNIKTLHRYINSSIRWELNYVSYLKQRLFPNQDVENWNEIELDINRTIAALDEITNPLLQCLNELETNGHEHYKDDDIVLGFLGAFSRFPVIKNPYHYLATLNGESNCNFSSIWNTLNISEHMYNLSNSAPHYPYLAMVQALLLAHVGQEQYAISTLQRWLGTFCKKGQLHPPRDIDPTEAHAVLDDWIAKRCLKAQNRSSFPASENERNTILGKWRDTLCTNGWPNEPTKTPEHQTSPSHSPGPWINAFCANGRPRLTVALNEVRMFRLRLHILRLASHIDLGETGTYNLNYIQSAEDVLQQARLFGDFQHKSSCNEFPKSNQTALFIIFKLTEQNNFADWVRRKERSAHRDRANQYANQAIAYNFHSCIRSSYLPPVLRDWYRANFFDTHAHITQFVAKDNYRLGQLKAPDAERAHRRAIRSWRMGLQLLSGVVRQAGTKTNTQWHHKVMSLYEDIEWQLSRTKRKLKSSQRR